MGRLLDSMFMADLALLVQHSLSAKSKRIIHLGILRVTLSGHVCIILHSHPFPLTFSRGSGMIIPSGKINNREVQRASRPV